MSNETGFREQLVYDTLGALKTAKTQADEWPKDHLFAQPAAGLAKADIGFLNALEDPGPRMEGAAAIASIADRQSAYKEALLTHHQPELREIAAHARFTVQLEVPGQGAKVLDFTNDPALAMERYAHEARREFIVAQPAGTSVSLTDTSLKLDASRTSEGTGVFREMFGKQEAREAFTAAEARMIERTGVRPELQEEAKRIWSGSWTSDDGITEVRPFVEKAGDVFLAGREVSYQGGEPSASIEQESLSLEAAKKAAGRAVDDYLFGPTRSSQAQETTAAKEAPSVDKIQVVDGGDKLMYSATAERRNVLQPAAVKEAIAGTRARDAAAEARGEAAIAAPREIRTQEPNTATAGQAHAGATRAAPAATASKETPYVAGKAAASANGLATAKTLQAQAAPAAKPGKHTR